jgi:hypothetical protein
MVTMRAATMTTPTSASRFSFTIHSSISSGSALDEARTTGSSEFRSSSGVPSKPAAPLIQHRDSVGHAEGALDVVGDDDPRHPQLVLHPVDETVDHGPGHRDPARWWARRRECSGGRVAMARAIPARLRCPPESSEGTGHPIPSSPTSSRHSSTRSSRSRRRPPPSAAAPFPRSPPPSWSRRGRRTGTRTPPSG